MRYSGGSGSDSHTCREAAMDNVREESHQHCTASRTRWSRDRNQRRAASTLYS